MNYIIITPAKNEEKYLHYTIDSVISQKVLPMQYVIVVDKSVDNTYNIALEYANKHKWIKVLKYNSNHSIKEGGAPVVSSFLYGYDYIKKINYDVIAKIDADLTIPVDYFEKVLEEFNNNNKTGICGGYCIINKGVGIKIEGKSNYQLRGAIKSYRKECYLEMGGLLKSLRWDGIDSMLADYYGWSTKILELQVLHHRVTGTDINNGMKASFNYGCIDYRLRYDPLLAVIRSISQSFRLMPYIISSIAYLSGYIKSYLNNENKLVNKNIGKHIRKCQYKRYHYRMIKIVTQLKKMIQKIIWL